MIRTRTSGNLIIHFANFNSLSWLTSMGVVTAASLSWSAVMRARRAIDLYITRDVQNNCIIIKGITEPRGRVKFEEGGNISIDPYLLYEYRMD